MADRALRSAGANCHGEESHLDGWTKWLVAHFQLYRGKLDSTAQADNGIPARFRDAVLQNNRQNMSNTISNQGHRMDAEIPMKRLMIGRVPNKLLNHFEHEHVPVDKAAMANRIACVRLVVLI